MPRKREGERRHDRPRTDLPPEREPYYEGYFGTEEEEGVERERDAGEEVERERGAGGEGDDEEAMRERSAAEDGAGGDTEI